MQAQVLPLGNVWPPSYYNQCPVHLLTSLGSIVSRLYGQGFSPYMYQTSPFSAAGRPLGAGFVGYQTTPSGSPYNPQCPWPLIRAMISQIQQYVNALQASQQGGTVANNPFAFQSSVARGIPPCFCRKRRIPCGRPFIGSLRFCVSRKFTSSFRWNVSWTSARSFWWYISGTFSCSFRRWVARKFTQSLR